MTKKISLQTVNKTDTGLREKMAVHYSQPKGFVGRSICYEISFDGVVYGYIVGGSAPKHLPGRDEFFNITSDHKSSLLQQIIDNIFFHIEPLAGKYPIRNFGQKVLGVWREKIKQDWSDKYNSPVLGFESLVELPRTGEVYRRDGWTCVGQTKGFTCKRTSGRGTDSWSGKRVWDTKNLRPKLVFVKNI